MKPVISFFLSTIFLVAVSCTAKSYTLSNGRQIDPKLVGKWTGSIKTQQYKGREKEWETNRKKDETYTKLYLYKDNGEIHHQIETGSCWVKNGKYHEFNNNIMMEESMIMT